MDEGWTLGELVSRVAEALAAADVRAPNGRVTGLPDARIVRWYATIGLVDRPLGARGRTALYGPRHLLQLVAVKRLQARGRTLAEIQFELAGASEDTLRRVAALPVGSPAFAPASPAASPAPPDGAAKNGSPRFWAKAPTTAAAPATPMPAPITGAVPATGLPAPTTDAVPATPPRVPATAMPVPATHPVRAAAPDAAPDAPARRTTTPVPPTTTPVPPTTTPVPPTARPGPPASEPVPGGAEPAVYGLNLGGGALLLVPSAAAGRHAAAIRAAAAPLLDLLAANGLLNTDDEGAPA